MTPRQTIKSQDLNDEENSFQGAPPVTGYCQHLIKALNIFLEKSNLRTMTLNATTSFYTRTSPSNDVQTTELTTITTTTTWKLFG